MDWHPIATAPMNGTRMLLCAVINGRPFVFTGGYDPHWSGKCWVADHPQVSSGFKPTHWARLPDAPPEVA